MPCIANGGTKKGTGDIAPPGGRDDGGWPSQALAGVAGVVAALVEE